MRNTKIRIHKSTAAACVAAVAMSGAFAPMANAQPAPPPPPAATAPGPAAPPPALEALPPAPTPEQIQTSILHLIEVGRVAVAVGAEGLRIAFEALNAAEQAVVAADNNYRVAEAEHGAGSPEAVAAGAQKDLTESKVETAGLKGDEEAASVATPESRERREAASVAPALDRQKGGPEKAETPEPDSELGKAIKDVREKQEAYTETAQAERDLLKRTDANPATVQELREAAEKTRIAEEELVAAIDKLEKLAEPEEEEPAKGTGGAPDARPEAADESEGDSGPEEGPARTTSPSAAPERGESAGKADGVAGAGVSPSSATPAAPATTTATPTSEAPAPAAPAAPATTTPAAPAAPATTTPAAEAGPASPNGGGNEAEPLPADDEAEDTPPSGAAPDTAGGPQDEEAPGSEDDPEKLVEEYNNLLGGPDGLYAKEAKAKDRADAAARAMDEYLKIGHRGDVKDLAPFWEFLADEEDAAAIVGEAIGKPLGERTHQANSGPARNRPGDRNTGGGAFILTTPGTRLCPEKDPGNINDVGYGNYHCRAIFRDGPDAVKARVAEWAELKDKPDDDPKKKEFLEKYVTEDSQHIVGKSEDSRRIAVLDEMVAVSEMVDKTAREYEEAVQARAEVTGKLEGVGLRPIPGAAGKGADKVVEPRK